MYIDTHKDGEVVGNLYSNTMICTMTRCKSTVWSPSSTPFPNIINTGRKLIRNSNDTIRLNKKEREDEEKAV